MRGDFEMVLKMSEVQACKIQLLMPLAKFRQDLYTIQY